MIRLYLHDAPCLTKGQNITLPSEQSHYLTSVMRLGLGAQICVFNGKDGEWVAKITALAKKAVTIDLIEQLRPQPTICGPVLAIALIKRAPLETVIEKATELGVQKIELLITRRTNAAHTNLGRLTLIAREAAEQSGRLDVPEIVDPIKLDDWLLKQDDRAIVFADEDSINDASGAKTLSILQGFQSLEPDKPTSILIGPEGGFDPLERQNLNLRPHIIRVNMGPLVLRADTAAISALGLYQSACGNWRPC